MDKTFNEFVEMGGTDSIDYQELKPLLLHLNLKMSDEMMNGYLDNINTQESESGSGALPSRISHDTFSKLYLNILANQNEYFRHVYRDEVKNLDYKWMAEMTVKDAKTIFSKYDPESKGFITYDSLCEMFEDMGLKDRFRHTFDSFMAE